MFPHIPVQPSTECMRTYTLNFGPIFFFDGTCHKTQSQTNLHPYIDHHNRQGQPLPTSVLTVKEGEMVFVAAGERFHPIFPLAGINYVTVHFPAFRAYQCLHEEEEEEEESPVSDKLKSLHNGAYVETIEVHFQSSDTDDPEEVLFHMDQHELYESVAASGEAYFPPTFEADGMFTHATAVTTHLITTANHLYTGTKG